MPLYQQKAIKTGRTEHQDAKMTSMRPLLNELNDIPYLNTTPTDSRYKLKGFGLRFSDRTRAVIFGGMNNINETMEYNGNNSSYNDEQQQSGDRHFRQVGISHTVSTALTNCLGNSPLRPISL